MSNLSKALEKYYIKKDTKVIFRDTYPLSALAIAMWEQLGFQKMDASVLSRVLHGERLFTPSQLQVFCQLLQLSKDEEEFLFHNLAQDYFMRDNVILSSQSTSQEELLHVLEKLVLFSVEMFYAGKSQEVIKQSDIIDTIFDKIVIDALSLESRKRLFTQYGYYCFLRERSIAGTYDKKMAKRSIAQTIRFLEKQSTRNALPQLLAYARMLQADIYYMEDSYGNAMRAAHSAFVLLPDDHREKFAALRLMVACACYVKDAETVRFAEDMSQKLLAQQSDENVVNALHLSKILSKGKVMLGDRDPFALETVVTNHFAHASYENGIYYQLSDIKTRIETFSLFHIKDKTILQPLIEQGLSLTNQGNYPRHNKFLQQQLINIS